MYGKALIGLLPSETRGFSLIGEKSYVNSRGNWVNLVASPMSENPRVSDGSKPMSALPYTCRIP